MSEPEPDRDTRDQLLSEAAAWFARMRGPDAETSRRSFERWLGRGALHRLAYNRAAEIFAMGKLLAHDDPSSIAEPVRTPRSARLVAAALAVTLLALVGGWLALPTEDRPKAADPRTRRATENSPPVQMSTAANGHRAVRMADGSLVNLARLTSLRSRFTRSERRLVLERGTAVFDVAHEARPFVVYAGGGSVTAVGTLFSVRLGEDRRVAVRLFRGVVDVALPDSTGPAIIRRLRPGQGLSFEALDQVPGPSAPALPVQPGSASAGRTQPREFDRVTVAELISAANRGSTRPIRLEDSAIAPKRISGRFRTDDPDLLAERIAGLFDLAIDRSRPGIILLRPA
jgi:transmembrane sensor